MLEAPSLRERFLRAARKLYPHAADFGNLTEQEIREYQTGSWVFIKAGGRLVDAMEDFQVVFSNLSDQLAA